MKTKRITIRLDENEEKFIKRYSKASGISQASLIRKLIRIFLLTSMG
jgi:hypothetical protein